MLRVIDRSDTGADLAWAPQAGATAYRVFRAGADGPFAAVAEVAGPSFADSGLTPKTAYRWRVAAIVNGVEGPASGEAAATTRPVPATLRHTRRLPDWRMMNGRRLLILHAAGFLMAACISS
ncbi:fibronectin type III domain-containing protein [Bradyrhizobium sediminis]|uniref:Fibronectin type III domain-containing protein n=1 Tax=Bradyrhizobium sediminis TaxID=2840469 RepID=A0A975NEN8_9BRAD|nr:fibronectin type III domain-containing protein [Bradyrhizobium sediminis]QWG13672.1 fibronectin type III domain-containing protein [Bradyrhizobium sediminis]